MKNIFRDSLMSFISLYLWFILIRNHSACFYEWYQLLINSSSYGDHYSLVWWSLQLYLVIAIFIYDVQHKYIGFLPNIFWVIFWKTYWIREYTTTRGGWIVVSDFCVVNNKHLHRGCSQMTNTLVTCLQRVFSNIASAKIKIDAESKAHTIFTWNTPLA